jgi:hypothetical protein
LDISWGASRLAPRNTQYPISVHANCFHLPHGQQFQQASENLVPVLAVESQGHLRGEQAVLYPHVEALGVLLVGQVLLAAGQLVQGGGEGQTGSALFGQQAAQNLHQRRGEDVHPKEAEIVAGPQARRD